MDCSYTGDFYTLTPTTKNEPPSPPPHQHHHQHGGLIIIIMIMDSDRPSSEILANGLGCNGVRHSKLSWFIIHKGTRQSRIVSFVKFWLYENKLFLLWCQKLKKIGCELSHYVESKPKVWQMSHFFSTLTGSLRTQF